MTIEEKVYALLSAAAGVIACVPVDRIKPPGNWQSMTRPYIVHFPVAPDLIRTHEGRAALMRWGSYQISCFADSYSDARTLSQAVVTALDGNHDGVQFNWNDQTYMYETQPQIHQIALGFEVFEAL